jgi:hypothetical protein
MLAGGNTFGRLRGDPRGREERRFGEDAMVANLARGSRLGDESIVVESSYASCWKDSEGPASFSGHGWILREKFDVS